MLDFIVSSKTRNNILIKFFLFEGVESYLRKMEKEFDESSNAIRRELNRFTDAGLLITESKGKKRFYKANTEHPFYFPLKSFIRKTIGIDQIVTHITEKIKNLELAYITGCIAKGKEPDNVELVLVGQNLDDSSISSSVRKVEILIAKKINYISFTREQMKYFSKEKCKLLIWEKDSKIEL